jgi:hypothetical protein
MREEKDQPRTLSKIFRQKFTMESKNDDLVEPTEFHTVFQEIQDELLGVGSDEGPEADAGEDEDSDTWQQKGKKSAKGKKPKKAPAKPAKHAKRKSEDTHYPEDDKNPLPFSGLTEDEYIPG